jgi:peroxiredoxin
MGIERTTFIIDEEGIIIAIFPKVRVKGHIQALVDHLQ